MVWEWIKEKTENESRKSLKLDQEKDWNWINEKPKLDQRKDWAWVKEKIGTGLREKTRNGKLDQEKEWNWIMEKADVCSSMHQVKELMGKINDAVI